ncbi:MAG TPA: alanine racemase [Candidatus Dormibacteraeota bacterium]|nr:alanine racemase [Candidatus Dormibacteraeota bacterium]
MSPGPSILKWAEVDLDAIAFNIGQVQRAIGPDSRLLAVVKADAYGHGVGPVAVTALKSGSWGLAVSTLEEAIPLRGLCPPDRTLIMGGLSPDQASVAAELGCAVTCSTFELAAALERSASRRPIPVHLKVDTGMGRHGCRPDAAAALAKLIADSNHLRLAGVMTHFAQAEADGGFTQHQFEVFQAVIAGLGIDPGVRHACNSAAALRFPEMAMDVVRAGIALYGCEWQTLRPALALRSRLVQVKEIEAGGSVGYGRTWVAPGSTLVGLVPIGYADGVHRARSGKGWTLVGGKRAPLLGRVSMDTIAVDLTEVANPCIGDVVTLIGADGEEEISAEQVGAWSGTVSYEVVTSIGPRVERHYRKGGGYL